MSTTASWASRSPSGWPATTARAGAEARRATNTAVDAIDATLAELHQLRARLIPEIRDSDDATAARADALLTSKPPHDLR